MAAIKRPYYVSIRPYVSIGAHSDNISQISWQLVIFIRFLSAYINEPYNQG